MSHRHAIQRRTRRALTALAFTFLVSLAPASGFSLWDFLVSLLANTDAGVRIDDNGLA